MQRQTVGQWNTAESPETDTHRGISFMNSAEQQGRDGVCINGIGSTGDPCRKMCLDTKGIQQN